MCQLCFEFSYFYSGTAGAVRLIRTNVTSSICFKIPIIFIVNCLQWRGQEMEIIDYELYIEEFVVGNDILTGGATCYMYYGCHSVNTMVQSKAL